MKAEPLTVGEGLEGPACETGREPSPEIFVGSESELSTGCSQGRFGSGELSSSPSRVKSTTSIRRACLKDRRQKQQTKRELRAS